MSENWLLETSGAGLTLELDPNRVEARPAKRFFISMLIKDIELVPAIIDLVDNSVDAARSLRGTAGYEGLTVGLTLTPEVFEIFDNCGGIEAHIAKNYAFRFGRPLDFEPVPSSVGQFGVGMKRALFKIGNQIRVQSAARQSTFTLNLNVTEWAAEDDHDWTFRFAEVDYNNGVPEDLRSTRITVTELHEYVAADLGIAATANRLRSQLALKHQSAISRGLHVEVNGLTVEGATPTLLMSDDFVPIKKRLTVPVNHAGELDVTIIAGVAPPTRVDTRDDDIAEDFTETGEAGWYVYCNDRLVLEADRSSATGWGSAGAAYHPQYRQFRGYVFMNAADSSLLPWNTTKNGLDRDAPAFRRVQAEMQAVLQEVQAVINRHKREASFARSRATPATPLVEALSSAIPYSLETLPNSDRLQFPPPTAQNPTPDTETNVQYRVPTGLMRQAMEALDQNSASAVGRATFDYFVNAELDLNEG